MYIDRYVKIYLEYAYNKKLKEIWIIWNISLLISLHQSQTKLKKKSYI